MDTSKAMLHKLVDLLPQNEEATVAKFILFLLGQNSLQLEDIKAELDVRQGRVISFDTLEELKAHLYQSPGNG
ncbi:MAG: hypothetical protein RDV48_09460 [Candidatus Eremiobacteraeota bacterium]|nr:hypothetical protein [Candidatus Eremiobacteraeota bacterium]